MKYAILICLVMHTLLCCSQNTEFGKSSNGLIYADSTVKQLKFIVDSLNLKFKVCELNRVYKSKMQAKVNYVYINNTDVPNAKKDIEANISFDDFIKKYDSARTEKDLLVIRYKYKNYQNKDVLSFSCVQLNTGEHELEFEEDISQYEKPLKGRWIYKYYKGTQYSKECIYAFYFVDELAQQPIPDNYARMIQYSDCLIDTSTQVIYADARESGVRYAYKSSPALNKLTKYLDSKTHKPKYNPKDEEDDANEEEDYEDKIEIWDSLRLHRVDSLKTNDKKFNKLFAQAIEEVKDKGIADEYFEEYVGRYYSKKLELELKRRRRVIGGCSMDNSPRLHAQQIAILAAETVNWEIFLRSHL